MLMFRKIRCFRNNCDLTRRNAGFSEYEKVVVPLCGSCQFYPTASLAVLVLDDLVILCSSVPFVFSLSFIQVEMAEYSEVEFKLCTSHIF